MTEKRLGITLAALLTTTLALSFGTIIGSTSKLSVAETSKATITMENLSAQAGFELVEMSKEEASFEQDLTAKVAAEAEKLADKVTAQATTQQTTAKVEEVQTTTAKAETTVNQTTTVKAETTAVQETAPVQTVDPVAQAQAAVNSASNSVEKILALTNLERAKAGLGSLYLDNTLSAMANIRAQEIVETWSHTRPDGTNITAIARDYGYSYSVLGENLAKGQATETQAVAEWMASEGHRANILGNYNRMGVGVFSANGRMYWVQIFAR